VEEAIELASEVARKENKVKAEMLLGRTIFEISSSSDTFQLSSIKPNRNKRISNSYSHQTQLLEVPLPALCGSFLTNSATPINFRSRGTAQICEA